MINIKRPLNAISFLHSLCSTNLFSINYEKAKRLSFLILLVALNLSVLTKAQVAFGQSETPQFIAISFDGSKSLNMWQRTRQMAKSSGARITYFVSGVYMLGNDKKNLYREPQRGVGRSAIGWGGTREDLNGRIQQMLAAAEEGHEISSHGNGHFDGGSGWSLQQWLSEFDQFHDFLYGIFHNNGLSASADLMDRWRRTLDQSILGFRAPLLEVNSNMYQVLGKQDWQLTSEPPSHRYLYDASKVSGTSYWPEKTTMGTWNFPLANLRIAGSSRRTLSMDYNFYVAQSKAQPQPDKAAQFEQEMFDTYMRWFNENYSSHRAPMNIGHHFSLWNGGAYFRALERFATAVCSKPQVICGTYGELVTMLNARAGSFRPLAKTETPNEENSEVDGFALNESYPNFSQNVFSAQQMIELYPEETSLHGDRPEAHEEN